MGLLRSYRNTICMVANCQKNEMMIKTDAQICPSCRGTMVYTWAAGGFKFNCPKCKRQEMMFEHFNIAFLNGSPIVIVLAKEVEVAADNKISRLVFTNETVDTLEVSSKGIMVTKDYSSEFISMSQVFSISTNIEGIEE